MRATMLYLKEHISELISHLEDEQTFIDSTRYIAV